MRISFFGIGYVGCVMAGCLAGQNTVIGVDTDPVKVELVNRGQPSVYEKGLQELFSVAHTKGQLSATTNYEYAVRESDISFITVGTPGKADGTLDLSAIYDVCGRIGEVLKQKQTFHTVVIRSTVTPGTNAAVTEIIEQHSGKKRDEDFAVVSNPEFLREGSAVADFYHPGVMVVGSTSQYAVDLLRELYRDIDGEFTAVDIGVAEIIKYVNNTYHALKVCFGNEIGSICKALNIDSAKVMEVFCKDKKLNLSEYYFRPGFAYGGSCLPKDLSALKTLAEECGVVTPVIDGIEQSNQERIADAIRMILRYGQKQVGIIGLTFKEGTDDLRFSPILRVIEELDRQGLTVYAHDPFVDGRQETAEISAFFQKYMQHYPVTLVGDMDTLLRQNSLVIVSNNNKKYAQLVRQYPQVQFIDLTGQFGYREYPNAEALTR